MTTQTKRWIILAKALGFLACVLLSTSAVAAEDPAGKPDPFGPSMRYFVAAPALKLSDYWLGIECYPVTPALRAQLNLPEGQGLVVEQVLPEGPAAGAGLKAHDVLLRAGDKVLKDVADLIQAIDASKDKEMTLEVIRGGKPTKINVKPARRPAEPPSSIWPGTPSSRLPDWERFRKWFEQIRPGPGGVMRYRFFHPGTILPPGTMAEPGLPSNMTITITKQGNEPARIVVTRDKEKWDVTEKELDKLPADIRPHVERLLGRGVFGLGLGFGGMGVDFPADPIVGPADPGAPKTPGGPQAKPDRPLRHPGGAIERRLEEMNRRIDQLFRSLEELRQQGREKAPEKKPEKPTLQTGSRV